jgi:hypothetical protein
VLLPFVFPPDFLFTFEPGCAGINRLYSGSLFSAPQPVSPVFMRLSENPTAVYLAAFQKLCQQEKSSFHRFLLAFSGFCRKYAVF